MTIEDKNKQFLLCTPIRECRSSLFEERAKLFVTETVFMEQRVKHLNISSEKMGKRVENNILDQVQNFNLVNCEKIEKLNGESIIQDIHGISSKNYIPKQYFENNGRKKYMDPNYKLQKSIKLFNSIERAKREINEPVFAKISEAHDFNSSNFEFEKNTRIKIKFEDSLIFMDQAENRNNETTDNTAAKMVNKILLDRKK